MTLGNAQNNLGSAMFGIPAEKLLPWADIAYFGALLAVAVFTVISVVAGICAVSLKCPYQ